MTRVTHGQKQSSPPPKKEAPKSLLPQKSTIKIWANSHPEIRQATVCITRRVHIKNQTNSLSATRQATVCITRRVHIKNQTNSPPETITRRVHIKNQANSPPETRQATVCVTRRVHIKSQANSPLKWDRPQSLLLEEYKPDQLTLSNKTGHSLSHQKSAH